MLSVVVWKWRSPSGPNFGPEYVNRLRGMLDRHVHLPHRLYCVTDDPAGIDGDVHVVPMPETYAHTPRCRRRMQQYSRDWRGIVGARMLAIDLDVVIIDDLTPVLDRAEPIVGWKVGHAGVYSGSFLLCDTGALHEAWAPFQRDPDGYPRKVQPAGVPSDQAMLNYWLARRPPIAEWTETDGFVSYYGKGYERLEHLGVGPCRPHLPPGARIVVLGSADKAVMDEGRYPWVIEHWGAPLTTEVRV